MAKIGVFDSGIGGESVANALRSALPQSEIIYASDTQHVPYGDKTPQQVLGFVVPILQQLVDQQCDLIVIACNTVTTHHIAALRGIFQVPLVGIEPMIKPAAAATKTGTIAVCATPATLASPRYAELKQRYAQKVRVIEPDCSNWAYMIEHNQLNQQAIAAQIDDLCTAGADVIVLGCTHYHWIQDVIQNITRDRAQVIQPEAAIVERVRSLVSPSQSRISKI